MLRAIHESTEEIEVLIDNSQVLFRVGDTEITSRLIDGNYPDYRQLIPSSSETGITLETSEFMRLVKIAGLFARESGGSITVRPRNKTSNLPSSPSPLNMARTPPPPKQLSRMTGKLPLILDILSMPYLLSMNRLSLSGLVAVSHLV